jgi:PiT family inorganic phosphate transporter
MDLTVAVIVAGLAGLYVAWNIGVNDVANTVATSVATRALSIRGALVVASIAGILGALTASGPVNETLQSGLLEVETFANAPDDLVLGICLSLVAAVAWLELASRRGWPVSSTQCVVGALLGFALASRGTAGLDGFAVLRVGAAWIFSPLASGALAFSLFVVLRRRVLLVERPMLSARAWAPFMVAPLFAIVALVVTTDDRSALSIDIGYHAPVLAGILAVFGGIVGAILVRRIASPPAQAPHKERVRRAEEVFAGLQVASTCYVAFAQASNDVANVIGPLSLAFDVAATGEVAPSTIPVGIVMVATLAMVLGATTYGYRVLGTVSQQIADLSPSRAFTAEFATATTILVATSFGLPVSTTHTLVGGMLGVGLARSLGAIDSQALRRIALGWVATGPIAAAASATLYLGAKLFL